MLKRIASIFLLALASALALAPPAKAQDSTSQKWPQRGVRFVVAFAPAGIADPIGRFVGAALQEKWGQPVIVENRGGGGGNIGASAVARAEPDGYTVLVTTSAFSVNVSLYKNPGYAAADFQTVAVPAISPNIVVAAPGFKYNTLKEIFAAAKTENLSFGSAGIGTTPHLSGEQIFNVLGKADIRHVPFTGAGPAVAAIMGGHVPLGVMALPAAIAQVKAGSLKAIALTTAERRADLPDVPTVNESGVGKVESATMVGFFMPAKTPRAIVEKFNADLNAIIASGALDKQFEAAGATPTRFNPAQAQSYIDAEILQWAAIVKAIDLKAE